MPTCERPLERWRANERPFLILPYAATTLRGDSMRGDDLVGGAAGDLRHAVELPCKTAGAGGGRPQLHDQVADLGFRHGGADAVPSRPVLAGVEAEDLAPPCRQNGVDLRRRLRR